MIFCNSLHFIEMSSFQQILPVIIWLGFALLFHTTQITEFSLKL